MKSHYSVKDCGTLGMSVKDVSSKSRVVTGFFNTYNFLDSDGDVLMPGAAKKSITERGVESQATAKIKHALNHDLTQLPGKLQVLEEKTVDGITGIYFESKLADTTLGNDTLKNYLAGIYDNHSIGFQYMKYRFIEKESHGNSKQWDNVVSQLVNAKDANERGSIMAVDEIKLFEGSTVAFGANSLTPFLGMGKSTNKDALLIALNTRVDTLESTLKNGTQSDDMMMSIEVQLLQLKELHKELTNIVSTRPQATTAAPEIKKTVIDYGKLAAQL